MHAKNKRCVQRVRTSEEKASPASSAELVPTARQLVTYSVSSLSRMASSFSFVSYTSAARSAYSIPLPHLTRPLPEVHASRVHTQSEWLSSWAGSLSRHTAYSSKLARRFFSVCGSMRGTLT